METTYGSQYSRLYHLHFEEYARELAPRIIDFFSQQEISKTYNTALDIGCGTGILAQQLLLAGYKVVGVDLSSHMIHYAIENTIEYIKDQHALFLQGDMIYLPLNYTFGLVTSTYYSLNHLPDWISFVKCIKSIYSNLILGGVFIFDLSTEAGEKRWNNISVQEMDDYILIRRGTYDAKSQKSFFRLSGAINSTEGKYERFEITASNTMFPSQSVIELLLNIGWRNAYKARLDDLAIPITQSDLEVERVFIVAIK